LTQVWDLGGQDKLRKVWATYYVGASAVILVVDSMDRARLSQLRDEFEVRATCTGPRARTAVTGAMCWPCCARWVPVRPRLAD